MLSVEWWFVYDPSDEKKEELAARPEYQRPDASEPTDAGMFSVDEGMLNWPLDMKLRRELEEEERDGKPNLRQRKCRTARTRHDEGFLVSMQYVNEMLREMDMNDEASTDRAKAATRAEANGSQSGSRLGRRPSIATLGQQRMESDSREQGGKGESVASSLKAAKMRAAALAGNEGPFFMYEFIGARLYTGPLFVK